MRKVFSLLLILCLCMGLLAGCGEEEKKQTAQETTTPTQPLVTEPEGEDEEIDGDYDEEGPFEQITFKHTEITLVAQGEAYTLYTGTAALADVTFGSENEQIATFVNGVVTAVSKGDTTVYAEYDGVRMTCLVHCNLKTTATEPTTPNNDDPTDPTEATSPKDPVGNGPRDPSVAAPTNQTVSTSFFDDAVFVGDSISLKLSQYAASSGALGKAKFLVVGSYGVNNAVNDHPDTKLTYQGVSYVNIEDALAATGAKKVFIMLGMNDIGLYGIDKTITNWGVLLDMLKTKCPGITIYIQSMTPVWTGGEKGKLTNANVLTYNARLEAFAAANGYKFINIHPYMQDSTGGLATVFCSDKYVHLTNEGAQRWIAVLKAYTGY